jgi:molecular chaperone DnaK (HSP70)
VSQPSRYTVGIDLGTTHCVLARGDPDAGLGQQPVELFEVPQLQAPGEVVTHNLLPSFMYLPDSHELPEGAAELPWGASEPGIVGEMARRRGSEVPDRLVHSAKSWLCHDGVDRTTPFLPRSQTELPRRVSPVEASAAYLEHLRRAWDHTVARGDPSLALAAQDLVVTVPASFGEVARRLSAEAAARAGLERVHLVEEPQAAFYSWLARHGANLDEALAGLNLILVVDVGGGTTDLTLIRVAHKQGEPELTRVAVGEHLMLGGDNMDLALAALVESRLREAESRPGANPGRLDGRRWQGLRQSCRVARETLLQEEAPEVASVVVPGRGSALVGGQLRVELTRQEVISSTLDDFFPEVGPDVEVRRRTGLGLQEWGLPYAHDTAVTRHISMFMRRYRTETGDSAPLDGVLLNGGVLNPPLVARRLMEVIGSWTPAGQEPPRLLTTSSLDLAVALGAAYYGLVRRGRGIRIVSGLAHAVYVGLELRRKKKKGRKRVRRAALCLAPQGMQEGEQVELEEHQLNLTLGREVLFPLFAATDRGGRPGEVREADDPSLEALPPLRTRLPGSGSRGVPVTLRARLSEVGTLDLVAAKVDGSEEYRLEFDLRAQDEPAEESDERPTFRELDPGRVERAVTMLSECFGPESPPGSKNLVTRMERILKSKRDQWPLPTIRGFFEILRPDTAHRKGPLELEATWFNLTGFCLRPGYGYPGDAERLELMLPVLEAGCASWDHRARTEWWVLWRRVAGGLNRQVQTALFESLLQEINPARDRREAGPASAQEWLQIWMLASSLERVLASAKRDLGETILRSIETGQEPPQALWCLGRLGARALVHGGIETVVPTDRVEKWIEQLLALPGKKREHYPLALTLLARMTGDRSRDIDRELRQKVLERLGREKAQASWIRMVREVVVDEPIDRRMLGEALPPGLRLLA